MSLVDKLLQSNFFKTSLRVKVMVVFVLPMLVILSVFSYLHNQRELHELEEQVQISTIQLGEMALSGMRNALIRNDREVVTRILRNYGTNPSIEKMQIIGLDFRVMVSTDPEDDGKIVQTASAGCISCHKIPVATRPQSLPFEVNQTSLRVVIPIPNDMECQVCHSEKDAHLGVLILDAPLDEVIAYSKDEQIYNLGISMVSILFIAIMSYMLIQWLIVRRVGVLYHYLNNFATGDFSERIPKVWRTEDEITKLADHFNEIADVLERDRDALREISLVRQEAIAEERDRISRELHDGVAQFIGYVNTKTTAIRLLIQKNRIQEAEQQLAQIEQAVRDQSLDVRASIIGLRMASESGSGLVDGLHQFINQCNRLSDFDVRLEIGLNLEMIRLDAETELHLLRIVQEAMSNVRKHAFASQATVNVLLQDGELVIIIHDNGVGFIPWHWRGDHTGNFGLKNMHERAEMIGAKLTVESKPRQGTTVKVGLRLQE